MKKLLILLFSTLVSLNSYGDIVLYCQDELATGFFNENGAWKAGPYELRRYTIKFSDDYSSVSLNEVLPDLPCDYAFGDAIGSYFDIVVCNQPNGHNFKYDKVSKRYIYNQSSFFGYIEDSVDSDAMTAGTCQKF